MQRRNVLLPEPEGPIMHMTSFGWTSRSMPRSTSSRPKLLCTASALTMGIGFMSLVPPGEQHGQLLLGRRWRMEGEEHAPEALQWCRGEPTLGAASEASLDVVLADRKD